MYQNRQKKWRKINEQAFYPFFLNGMSVVVDNGHANQGSQFSSVPLENVHFGGA